MTPFAIADGLRSPLRGNNSLLSWIGRNFSAHVDWAVITARPEQKLERLLSSGVKAFLDFRSLSVDRVHRSWKFTRRVRPNVVGAQDSGWVPALSSASAVT